MTKSFTAGVTKPSNLFFRRSSTWELYQEKHPHAEAVEGPKLSSETCRRLFWRSQCSNSSENHQVMLAVEIHICLSWCGGGHGHRSLRIHILNGSFQSPLSWHLQQASTLKPSQTVPPTANQVFKCQSRGGHYSLKPLQQPYCWHFMGVLCIEDTQSRSYHPGHLTFSYSTPLFMMFPEPWVGCGRL